MPLHPFSIYLHCTTNTPSFFQICQVRIYDSDISPPLDKSIDRIVGYCNFCQLLTVIVDY